jgi:hypothetical protein
VGSHLSVYGPVLAELARSPKHCIWLPRSQVLLTQHGRQMLAVKGGAFAAVGMNCFARHSVVSLSGDELPLEGDIEDDGDCIDLRTPYDFRDGRFTDVANCVTDHW